jgi:hypothetical protein
MNNVCHVSQVLTLQNCISGVMVGVLISKAIDCDIILRLASSSVDLSCSKFFSTTFCFWSTLIRVTELLNIVNQDTNYRLIIIYIYTSLVLFHAVESDLV